MLIKPIPSIPGALAREDGMFKLPESKALMPNGGLRTYKTKWRRGTKTKAAQNARHKYFGTLYKGRNYKIHRLICEAFHGAPPFDGAVVIHLDENSLNNKVSNLRWGTQKENLNAPGFIAYCKSRTGENSPAAKARAKKNSMKIHFNICETLP
jgi:hypothetical protein